MSKASRRSRKERKGAPREPSRGRAAELRGSTVENVPATGLAKYGAIAAVVAVMVIVALVRFRLADVPLERDEGEYAYAGQLILQGIPPYQLAYNMKLPGTYYAYSLIEALFGQTARGIHTGLLLLNAATTLVIFYLGRRLMGPFGGAVSAIAFAILSLDRWVMGVFAHATHFVILPALGGFLLLVRPTESRTNASVIGAGLLLGISILMKQQAVFFMLLAIALVLLDGGAQKEHFRTRLLRTGLFLLSSVIPFAIICAVLTAQGVFDKFWFWTFQYAREYVSEIPLSSAWGMFVDGFKRITRATLLLWLLAAAGFVLLWVVRWKGEVRVFLTGLLLVSLLALSPGFYFRQHYFILLLPAAALLVGMACVSIKRGAARMMPATVSRGLAALVFVVATSAYVIKEQEYLFSLPTRDLSRDVYGANPFVESPDISRYLEEHTKPDDRIAVLGSEPQIYFYARRKSATGHIYTYGLMEPQKYKQRMQDEMIQEIEATRPEYIVFVKMSISWLARQSDEKILTWADQYTRQCYEIAGVVDIHSRERSEIVWDAAVLAYQPKSDNVIHIYRRKVGGQCTASS